MSLAHVKQLPASAALINDCSDPRDSVNDLVCIWSEVLRGFADWADDSGKWGELTRPKPEPLSAEAAQPKQSSISLADIAHSPAGRATTNVLPEPGHQPGVRSGSRSRVPDKEVKHSYLSLLESLAQESDFGSPGYSDNDNSPKATQMPKAEPSWREDPLAPSAGNLDIHDSPQLSEASASSEDDAVEALLPDNASDAHASGAVPSEAVLASSMLAAGNASQHLPEEEEQPSALAQALAALAATAAQKHAQQTSMQQPQPYGHAASASQAANAHDHEQASISSEESGDVLAEAAAAAAAAGLSRRQEDLPQPGQQATQLPAVLDPATTSDQVPFQPDALAGTRVASHSAEVGPSQVQFQIQEEAQQAQQEGKRQRESASGEYGGPGSSGPSWSSVAGADAHGIGRFRANQAVNYVGKSARRPKVSLTSSCKSIQSMLRVHLHAS